jgi:hypothetical protein
MQGRKVGYEVLESVLMERRAFRGAYCRRAYT